MGGHKSLTPEELLEKIFYYMNRLFEEKEFSTTIGLLTDLGRTLVNSDRASFWFWDRQNKQYWTMAAIDHEKIVMEEGDGIVGASMEQNAIIRINDPYGDARFNANIDKETGYHTKAILCIPVTNTDGVVLGAYQAINKCDEEGNPSGFQESDEKRLSLVAVFGGKALESYLLYNEGLYDELTGLQNRKGFFEFYTKRVIPCLEKNSVAIIMGDIDHFKTVNDRYGHNAGDAILKKVASILHNSLGVDDELVRWGGEEFILLLPRKNLEEAKIFAEKIREEMEHTVCIFEGNDISVTMSFGVDYIRKDYSPQENVKVVDEKLYQAKKTGRNKVV